MALKYYKSDFSLLVTIASRYQDSTGVVVPITTEVPFYFRFYLSGGSPESGYVASSDGNGVVKNCSIIDDTHVIVFFDRQQSQFGTGSLMLEAEFIIDDEHYEADSECNVKRLYSTGVELVSFADTDSEDNIDLEMILPIYAAGMNAEMRQNVADLMAEVFPLTVSYASHNAGTREVGTSVTPTATLSILRKGSDVSSAATITVTPSASVSGKTWIGTALSSGSATYNASVTQGGQEKALPALTWTFTNYRYHGAIDAVPSNYATAIKALATKELSTSTSLGETALEANKYYLFAVKGDVTLKCLHAQTGGVIGGCVTGTCTLAQENNASLTNTYSYILVPKSTQAWNFKISV